MVAPNRIDRQISDMEARKFLYTSDGEIAVRITGTGAFKQSGLNVAGKISEVVLNSTTWVALPATPLVDRNAITIQNISGVDIKLNFDNSTPGYTGILLANGNERFYDITETIVIYAKAASGTPTIIVEELS